MPWFKLLGLAAGAMLLLALNILAWQQQMFSPWVMIPLAIGLFLGLAWTAVVLVRAARKSGVQGRAAGGLNAAVSSAIVLGICIVLYAFTAAWGVSWDLTQEGRRDLAPQTVQILQTMTQEVKVTAIFLDVEDRLNWIARDKTMRFLEQCQRYTDLLRVELLDPQVERAQLEAMNISHVATQGTVVLSAGTRQRVITLSGGSPRLEERDFTNALINVLRGAEPKIYFLQGHGEWDLGDGESPRGAAAFADVLQKESYRVEPLFLQTANFEVPADCDVLVINGPRSDLFPQEIEALSNYLDRGGRVLLLINPLTQAGGGFAETPNLLSFLSANYGINLGMDLMLADIGMPQKTQRVMLGPDRGPFAEDQGDPTAFRGSFREDHPITRNFGFSMELVGVRSVQRAEVVPSGVSVTELVRTPPPYWGQRDVDRFIHSGGHAELSPGEETGPLAIVSVAVKTLEELAAEGQPRDARLVVIGDADMMTNAQIHHPGNFNFTFNTIAWLTESEDLIAIRPTGGETQPLVLSPIETRAVVWISTLLTLQLVIFSGVVVYLFRRRHQ